MTNCKTNGDILVSNPPQFRCEVCKRTWFIDEDTPKCTGKEPNQESIVKETIEDQREILQSLKDHDEGKKTISTEKIERAYNQESMEENIFACKECKRYSIATKPTVYKNCPCGGELFDPISLAVQQRDEWWKQEPMTVEHHKNITEKAVQQERGATTKKTQEILVKNLNNLKERFGDWDNGDENEPLLLKCEVMEVINLINNQS